MIVSVCLGGYNRILETRGLVNNTDLFFMVREAGQSKIRCQHGWLSALFLVLGQCLFHCVLRWQKGWGALWGRVHCLPGAWLVSPWLWATGWRIDPTSDANRRAGCSDHVPVSMEWHTPQVTGKHHLLTSRHLIFSKHLILSLLGSCCQKWGPGCYF